MGDDLMRDFGESVRGDPRQREAVRAAVEAERAAAAPTAAAVAALFPSLPAAEVARALAAHPLDPEAAVPALVAALEHHEAAAARTRATAFLASAVGETLGPNDVAAALEAAEGDEATALDVLLPRAALLETLAARHGAAGGGDRDGDGDRDASSALLLSRAQICALCRAHDWQPDAATRAVRAAHADAACAHLKLVFTALDDAVIAAAVRAADGDVPRAAHALAQRRAAAESGTPAVAAADSNDTAADAAVEAAAAAAVADDVRALTHLDQFQKSVRHHVARHARQGDAPAGAPPPARAAGASAAAASPGSAAPADEADDEDAAAATAKAPPVESSDAAATAAAVGSARCAVRLQALQTHPEVGGLIQVRWECTRGATKPGDWIGLYAKQALNREYTTYEWRGGKGDDVRSGAVEFRAPSTFGSFEARYLLHRTYEHVATSAPFTVGPQYELELVPHTRGEGESSSGGEAGFLLRWKQLSGKLYEKAWVGLFAAAEPSNRAYLAWEPLRGQDIWFAQPVKPGRYEFRLCPRGYQDVLRSASFVVRGEDTIRAELVGEELRVTFHVVSVDPYYDSAWVGLYRSHEAQLRQWRRYKYLHRTTGHARDGVVTFRLPKTEGEYDVRLLGNASYDNVLVRSAPFQLPGVKK